MRRVLLPALVVLCLLGGDRGARAADAQNGLAARLEQRLAAAGIPAGEIGIAVLTVEATPRPVFGRGQNQPLMPASVAKVLTAAAALDLLGPAYAFTTTVTGRGGLSDGVLAGDLVVHGTGDPNLSGRLGATEPTAVLDRLVEQVVAAGVRDVRGCLVLDDGPFDREFVHAGWTDADKEKWYGAPVAGLVFNDSCLDVTVAPADQLDVRALLTFPATSGPWGVENLTSTVSGTKHVVGASWSQGGQMVAVRGQVAQRGGDYTFHVPVPDPLAFFGGAFRARLEAGGVQLRGGMRPARDAGDRAPGRLLARHATGLPVTLEVMNRRSQNFYASEVFKACGAAVQGEGSWASGQAAVTEMLRRRGVNDEGRTEIVDGSGLAKTNRTTAGTVALLLLSFEQDLLRGPVLHRSLAAPGEEGTLDDRLLTSATKGRLRAKTGTLKQAGAHAMAGCLEPRGQQPGLVFAVLINTRTWRGDPRGLIDDLVGILAAP